MSNNYPVHACVSTVAKHIGFWCQHIADVVSPHLLNSGLYRHE
jgi:hypothetical protein